MLCANIVEVMPIISSFFGIVVFMFWRDHGPPHFHAKYGDDEVVIEIETGKVTGHVATRALAMIQEWRDQHKEELMADWKLAEQNRPSVRISPLE